MGCETLYQRIVGNFELTCVQGTKENLVETYVNENYFSYLMCLNEVDICPLKLGLPHMIRNIPRFGKTAKTKHWLTISRTVTQHWFAAFARRTRSAELWQRQSLIAQALLSLAGFSWTDTEIPHTDVLVRFELSTNCRSSKRISSKSGTTNELPQTCDLHGCQLIKNMQC